jgi:hypothetical protein
MPSLQLGPIHLRQDLLVAPTVRHGPLEVVPILRRRQLVWRGHARRVLLYQARPDHLELITFAGTRRLALPRAHGPVRWLLAAGLLAPALAWRWLRRSSHGRSADGR